MGFEAKARVTIGDEVRESVRVHLDSSALSIGGRPARSFALTELRGLATKNGVLVFETSRGRVTVALGEDASSWAAKMKAPPSRAKKLGLVAGARIGLVGVSDAALESEIAAAGASVIAGRAAVDLLFLHATSVKALDSLATHAKRLADGGAIWVLREKGKNAPVPEAAVRNAAARVGLVDVKVAAFSETLTAEKLVRRKA